LEVTLNVVLPAAEVTAWFDGLTLKVGVAPDCVTVTVTGVKPTTVTVRVATRDVTEVFSVQVAEIVPFPVPEAVIVHQVWSLTDVHELFDVTEKDVAPAADVTFWFEGVTPNVGMAVVVN
jgi:hypothetical protein